MNGPVIAESRPMIESGRVVSRGVLDDRGRELSEPGLTAAEPVSSRTAIAPGSSGGGAGIVCAGTLPGDTSGMLPSTVGIGTVSASDAESSLRVHAATAATARKVNARRFTVAVAAC